MSIWFWNIEIPCRSGTQCSLYSSSDSCAVITTCMVRYWCSMKRCDMEWVGMIWCDIVWCGMVSAMAGVKWCGMVWCDIKRGGRKVVSIYNRVVGFFEAHRLLLSFWKYAPYLELDYILHKKVVNEPPFLFLHQGTVFKESSKVLLTGFCATSTFQKTRWCQNFSTVFFYISFMCSLVWKQFWCNKSEDHGLIVC